MKKLSLILIALMSLTAICLAAQQPDQLKHKSCLYCGMDRVKFAHSRMLIEYADGSSVGTCSIRCTAVEYVNAIDKAPVAIKVADYYSKELIDADKAWWVLVEGKRGVMTRRAKWAFADKAAAQKWISANGGELVRFKAAMEAAFVDLYNDTEMMRKKRQSKPIQSMQSMQHKEHKQHQ